MTEPKCAECSQPILEEDHVVSSHGDMLHVYCYRRLVSQNTIAESWVLIRRSRNLLNWPTAFGNERDGHGRPICPECRRVIRPAMSAARQGRFMVHIECWKRPAE
jgi:NAD-dependent SIR2 family protein deacetylase